MDRDHLKLVFYDVHDPEDKQFWAGSSAHVISGLRKAGQSVTSVGNLVPRLRRVLRAGLFHAYRVARNLHYHPDRHDLVTRFYTAIGNRRLRQHRDADAILTVSAAFAAYLEVPQPIFVLLDATWGQIVEMYPYFAADRQPAHIVRAGYALDRRAFAKPNLHLVMTSAWAADRAMQEYGMDPSRVHILPFGANFTDDPQRDLVMKAAAQRNGQHCNLLFVGREFDRKGGPIAVEIARNLNQMGVPATLHVVGCSPESMPDCVKVHGLLKKEIPGQLAQLQNLYATSDFFLLPTRAEAQGIVFNEAAAYALPVAATDVGGVSTVVQKDWGFLLPLEADAHQYAVWLRNAFQDRDSYKLLSENARKDFEARLSNTVYTQKLLGIIRGALHATRAA
ncbi:glycosyltransferase [Terriglobus roseus DSM 18391]|uniref:Glycosyltransferase n=1 Tax=Terriglobus roseus (strain DSM 18391 / NRRL B-41598 / KBS 63) TaxID=926566 RepID=I3ZFL7_TERRK|nr:glycosyltransferase family 4 protein [Terriglobus roseus]AFL88035.1 glycosyltransferase [Terriglobus roseus DSM 18391]